MWKPILATDDLPPIGARETLVLEFKAEYGSDSFEIAKDLAAFANAHGGTILIGAAGGDNIAVFKPLEPAGAKRCMRAVEEAVRDRCRPAPVFSVEQIAIKDGYLIAINVWPMPGMLAGVRVKNSELACGPQSKQPDDVFLFPLRVGTHIKAVLPEQIAMFLDAKIRRVAIGLEAAIGERAVLVTARSKDEKSIYLDTATIKTVSLLDNALELLVDAERGPALVAIPLDAVASVCRSTKGLHIYLEGRVRQMQWREGNPDELKSLDHFFDPLG